MSTAVTNAPCALKAWATRVVPVNRSRAVVAPAAAQICESTGTRRRFDPRYLITRQPYDAPMAETGTDAGADSHWVRWHEAYEDPVSPLSVRLRLVQAAVQAALDDAPDGRIRVISLCA